MEGFKFIVRDPERAYLGTRMWLPKKHVNTISIKASLEFEVSGEEGMEFLQLWEDSPHHIAVPREYVPPDTYGQLTFPIVDITPGNFPRAVFKSNVVLDKLQPDKDTQRKAFAAFIKADNGLLNLNCGKGKTTIALHAIAHFGHNALVIVNQTTILDQWEEKIREFLEFDGGIGLIRGSPSRWTWKRPIVVATLHTLAKYADQVTPEMRRWFGTIIWDECFVAGTLVDGVPIERRRVGDLVWSFDEHMGLFSKRPIERIFVSRPHALVSVLIDGVEIVCTPKHPFWTARGWVPALALSSDDTVLCSAQKQKVKAVRRVDSTPDGTFGGRCPNGLVYNLQIGGTPTYQVSSSNVVVHNCHHLAAPYFCITATMFCGRRFGLSATVNREDGTEVVYNYHLGEPFHKDLSQDVPTDIRFRQTLFQISPADYNEYVIDKAGKPNIGLLRSYVGRMEERNEYIAKDLRDAIAAGRKVLALSHSVDHLRLMHAKFLEEGYSTGICTGSVKVKERWEALRTKQLIFGTHQLVMEAIDEDSLDTLFWMTPFGSQHPEGGKNALQQGMGRIQGYRHHEGMKNPLVVIYDDVYIYLFHRMCNKLKLQLRRWPSDEGGPYEFKTLKPRRDQE